MGELWSAIVIKLAIFLNSRRGISRGSFSINSLSIFPDGFASPRIERQSMPRITPKNFCLPTSSFFLI
ncbi:hypothetical protein PUN28_011100 [Cardiocondyla obscurior]|uniref:Ycf15 n=1 Tax=Cardiocondyla obscurior TaxID=286306 RepID=A0AAW2FQ42_9HYME